MAVELCSDDSILCPRISFSHDFFETGFMSILEKRPPQQSSSSNSIIGADFCFKNNTINQETLPADQLFLKGKIVTTEIQKIINPFKPVPQQIPAVPPSCPLQRAVDHDATIVTPQIQVHDWRKGRGESQQVDAQGVTTITVKDLKNEGSKVIRINASKENTIDQEFSSASQQKKSNSPFSTLAALLDADDSDEDSNKNYSNCTKIKVASNKTPDCGKQNLKPSRRLKRSSSFSCVGICGGSLCRFPLVCRRNTDVSVSNAKRVPLSKKGHDHKIDSQNWKEMTGFSFPPVI